MPETTVRPVPTFRDRMAAAIRLAPAAAAGQDDAYTVRDLAAAIMLDAARDIGPAAIERYITDHRDDIPVTAVASDDVVENLLALIGTADIDVGWDTTAEIHRLRADLAGAHEELTINDTAWRADRDRYIAALAEIGRRALAADAGDEQALRATLRAIAAQANATGRPAAADRPRIVVLCGSTRFRDDFHRTAETLALQGHIVLAPGVFSGTTGTPLTDAQRAALADLHFRKIDMADEVYVVDPGGYVGESTRREIAYAEQTCKPIRHLSQETAGSRS